MGEMVKVGTGCGWLAGDAMEEMELVGEGGSLVARLGIGKKETKKKM